MNEESKTFVRLKYDIRAIRHNDVDVLHYVDLPKSFVLGTGHFYQDHNGIPTTRTNFLGRMPQHAIDDFIEQVIEYDRRR